MVKGKISRQTVNGKGVSIPKRKGRTTKLKITLKTTIYKKISENFLVRNIKYP